MIEKCVQNRQLNPKIEKESPKPKQDRPSQRAISPMHALITLQLACHPLSFQHVSKFETPLRRFGPPGSHGHDHPCRQCHVDAPCPIRYAERTTLCIQCSNTAIFVFSSPRCSLSSLCFQLFKVVISMGPNPMPKMRQAQRLLPTNNLNAFFSFSFLFLMMFYCTYSLLFKLNAVN